MLIGVILVVKVNRKRKTCSLHCHLFEESEFDWNDYLAHILLFFKKKIVAVAVLHTYVDQTSVGVPRMMLLAIPILTS